MDIFYLERTDKYVRNYIIDIFFGGNMKKRFIFDLDGTLLHGDLNLKPNKESYLNACGNYHVNECIMIGDTIEKDVIGPNKFGIDSIYYNPEKINLANHLKIIFRQPAFHAPGKLKSHTCQ